MFFLCFGIYPCSTFSQTLHSPRDKAWLMSHDNGEYYEGLFPEKIGTDEPVKLVSFVSFFEDYHFHRKEQLKIKFFSPIDQKYLLQAEELKPQLGYWMQDKNRNAKAAWNHFGPWLVDSYLASNDLKPSQIGVLVVFEPGIHALVAPAIVYYSEYPVDIKDYYLDIRLGHDFDRIEAAIYPGRDNIMNKMPVLELPVLRETFVAGETISIHFDPTKLVAERYYTVKLNLSSEANQFQYPYSFSFLHHPEVE